LSPHPSRGAPAHSAVRSHAHTDTWTLRRALANERGRRSRPARSCSFPFRLSPRTAAPSDDRFTRIATDPRRRWLRRRRRRPLGAGRRPCAQLDAGDRSVADGGARTRPLLAGLPTSLTAV
jgi:hypothetical protein